MKRTIVWIVCPQRMHSSSNLNPHSHPHLQACRHRIGLIHRLSRSSSSISSKCSFYAILSRISKNSPSFNLASHPIYVICWSNCQPTIIRKSPMITSVAPNAINIRWWSVSSSICYSIWWNMTCVRSLERVNTVRHWSRTIISISFFTRNKLENHRPIEFDSLFISSNYSPCIRRNAIKEKSFISVRMKRSSFNPWKISFDIFCNRRQSTSVLSSISDDAILSSSSVDHPLMWPNAYRSVLMCWNCAFYSWMKRIVAFDKSERVSRLCKGTIRFSSDCKILDHPVWRRCQPAQFHSLQYAFTARYSSAANQRIHRETISTETENDPSCQGILSKDRSKPLARMEWWSNRFCLGARRLVHCT